MEFPEISSNTAHGIGNSLNKLAIVFSLLKNGAYLYKILNIFVFIGQIKLSYYFAIVY